MKNLSDPNPLLDCRLRIARLAALIAGLALLAGVGPISSAETKVGELLTQARAAYQNGNQAEALALVSQAIEIDPKNERAYFLRASLHEASQRHEKAIADFDQFLKLNPRVTEAWQRRGTEHFKLGHFGQSIADFDKVIELAPQQGPQHWQRGIACYYAGRFADGRRQFESHQSVNPNDVENAVWHFLCVARLSGVDQARAALIPIQGDGRVPMMEVHALFAGKAKPEDVLAAARAGQPSAAELHQRLFFAHLYLGLYYEAIGDEKLTREHIFKSAEEFKSDHYMGDVARVHAEVLRRPATQRKPVVK